MTDVIGQLPSQFILTKVRPSIWIPSCELVWTVLTVTLAAATTSNQVIAIRFFVGLVESIFYPAAHFLIGSWYKPSELGKRACIFHASSALAGMCSGYLQALIYTGLNGALGKAGWQWLFIMDGLISLPICLAGFFLIPDLPENTRAFYLTPEDTHLAQKRMDEVGRAPRRKLGWSILTRVFKRWHVWVLTLLYIIFINLGSSSSINPLALWMKANGWSITMVVSLHLRDRRLLSSSKLTKVLYPERHTDNSIRRAAGHHRLFLCSIRLSEKSGDCDVGRDMLRILQCPSACHMDDTSSSKVGCVLYVAGSRCIRTSGNVVGQRNMRCGCRGACYCFGYYGQSYFRAEFPPLCTSGEPDRGFKSTSICGGLFTAATLGCVPRELWTLDAMNADRESSRTPVATLCIPGSHF